MTDEEKIEKLRKLKERKEFLLNEKNRLLLSKRDIELRLKAIRKEIKELQQDYWFQKFFN